MTSYLLEERHNNDEGRRDEGPRPRQDCPHVELGHVEEVDAEHGAGPDDDEEGGEEEAGDVGGDLGGAELPDDDVERGPVVEVVALLQVQLALGFKRGGVGLQITKGRFPSRFFAGNCSFSSTF